MVQSVISSCGWQQQAQSPASVQFPAHCELMKMGGALLSSLTIDTILDLCVCASMLWPILRPRFTSLATSVYWSHVAKWYCDSFHGPCELFCHPLSPEQAPQQ
jgi:hypothetical protein